jgi:hypothetical protein
MSEIFREAAFDTATLVIIINPDGLCNDTGLAQVFEQRS